MAYPFPSQPATQPSAPQMPMGQREWLGLQQSDPYKWKPPAQMSAERRPIDFLAPGTEQHAYILNYLLQRLNWSEQKMGQFYPRWQANEQRLQAYITLPEYDRILDDMRRNRKPPSPESIIVPYSWSSQQTIVTYMLHAFAGRKPIMQVGSYRGEQVQRAKNMETLLQYNYDYVSYIQHLYNLFTNGELYGVAIQRNTWSRETRLKTLTRPASPQLATFMGQLWPGSSPAEQRTTERVVCFEGNSISVINPFMFFPDPRVPMVQVAEKGEFVFWRQFEGRHLLLRAEAAGQLKWVKYAGSDGRAVGNDYGRGDSMAGLRALGDPLTSGGQNGWGSGFGVSNNIQVDQGSVEIIPAELGLGTSREPEKWLFTILNKTQIVQAEPLGMNHGQHPISVAEPNTFGHAFGQISTADLNAPIQDLLSWLVNSHMFNVRASLNNFIIADPNRVEMDDFLDPQPGGLVRAKSSPFGDKDIRNAVMQLQIGDVTRAHLADFPLIQRMGDGMTGASDNMRGLQDTGGRKTATEVRTTYEAGGSRLASRAMLYGQMLIVPSARQMASNYQQYLTSEMELRVLGNEGRDHSVRINPYSIEGDFYFPMHDGTLPLDRVAMMEVWKEIFMMLMQDPTGMMQQQYNAPAVFRFLAKLSGAQNIDEFSNGGAGGSQMLSANPEAIQQQAQAGNLVPMSAVPQMLGSMPGPQGSGLPPAAMMEAA